MCKKYCECKLCNISSSLAATSQAQKTKKRRGTSEKVFFLFHVSEAGLRYASSIFVCEWVLCGSSSYGKIADLKRKKKCLYSAVDGILCLDFFVDFLFALFVFECWILQETYRIVCNICRINFKFYFWMLNIILVLAKDSIANWNESWVLVLWFLHQLYFYLRSIYAVCAQLVCLFIYIHKVIHALRFDTQYGDRLLSPFTKHFVWFVCLLHVAQSFCIHKCIRLPFSALFLSFCVCLCIFSPYVVWLCCMHRIPHHTQWILLYKRHVCTYVQAGWRTTICVLNEREFWTNLILYLVIFQVENVVTQKKKILLLESHLHLSISTSI